MYCFSWILNEHNVIEFLLLFIFLHFDPNHKKYMELWQNSEDDGSWHTEKDAIKILYEEARLCKSP